MSNADKPQGAKRHWITVVVDEAFKQEIVDAAWEQHTDISKFTRAALEDALAAHKNAKLAEFLSD